MKKTWKGIKQIISIKSQMNNVPPKIKKEQIEITDSDQIANAFNEYFANIGTGFADEIPKVDKSPFDYLMSRLTESFYISPVSTFEIEEEITRLHCNKSSGPFSTSISILKKLKFVISKPLEILFNFSFNSGIVPENFKLARVVPVFKSGTQSNMGNYRPISLLSVFSKLLEKLMYNRLIDFIRKKSILYPKQFGFREQHSTDHALLSIVDKIQNSIDNREYSCGIFLDFSKAFDTVNHKILIQKLEHYGIRGVANDWFTSYLSGRNQAINFLWCASRIRVGSSIISFVY